MLNKIYFNLKKSVSLKNLTTLASFLIHKRSPTDSTVTLKATYLVSLPESAPLVLNCEQKNFRAEKKQKNLSVRQCNEYNDNGSIKYVLILKNLLLR